MIKSFPEKKIRESILRKIKPDIRSGKRAGHEKGFISIEKIELRIKIPNKHNKEIGYRISKMIAADLKLSHEEYNGLIECPISGTQYYEIIRKKLQ